jgi:hypothetical protein
MCFEAASVRLARESAGPRAARRVRAERALEGPVAAARQLRLDAAALARVAREDLDHAAERSAAVEIGRPAAQHLEPLDVEARGARPVDPAAKGVVERKPVGQHERAARAARSQAAQRHALRGGIRRAAARAAEEREADHLAQRIVDEGRGRDEQLLARKDRDARGRVGDPRRLARRGDGELFRQPRRLGRGRLLRLRVFGRDRGAREQGGERRCHGASRLSAR